jgi:hypothetical protein
MRFGVLFCLFCYSAIAQWVPLGAKIKIDKQLIGADGTQIKQQQINGRFLRWSDGTELNLTTLPSTSYETGTYIDGPKGIAYRVDTRQNTAIISYRFGGPRLPAHTAPPNRPSHVINGIYCLSVSIVGKYITSGEGCFSPDYQVMVKRDFNRRDGAFTVHTTEELYDISLGQEPDRKQLPDISKFRILQDVH